MKRIIIVGGESGDIRRELHGRLAYDIDAFRTAADVLEALQNHPISTTILVITDTGISPDAYGQYQGKADLKNLLQYVTFRADRVIYLNKSGDGRNTKTDSQLRDSVEFILNEYAEAEVEVYSEPEYRIERIKEIILTSKFNKDRHPEMGEVIIKRRGTKEVSAELIKEENITAPKVIYHPLAKQEHVNKLTIDREIPTDIGEDMPVIGGPEQDYVMDMLKPERKLKEKIIAVTGLRGTGVTTTALTLANTLSEIHKVLIIDLNIYNLGMSHTITKMKNEKLFNIGLPEILKNRMNERPINKIKDVIVNGKTLHALTLNKDLFELTCIDMIILNIVDAIGIEYDYIILDVPLIEETPYLMNLPDLFVICTPPFAPIVEETRRMFTNVLGPMNEKRKVSIRIGTKQNTPPVSQKYVEQRLEIPVTGILTLKPDYLSSPLLDIL